MVPVVVGPGFSDEVLLGLILVLLTLFGGLWGFTKVSWWYRSRQAESVGPHVVVPYREWYRGRVATNYRCKYCGKERELKGYFRDEDCEEFEAIQ